MGTAPLNAATNFEVVVIGSGVGGYSSRVVSDTGPVEGGFARRRI